MLKEGVDGLEVVKGQVDVHEVVLHPSQVHEGDVWLLVPAVSQLVVAASKHVMAAESPGLFVVSGGDVSGAEQLVIAEDPQ